MHNDRLIDALGLQAFCALRARAYFEQLRARGTGHRAALRQLGNRLVGILHGCLKTGTNYDENTAWPQNQKIFELHADRIPVSGLAAQLAMPCLMGIYHDRWR